MEDYPRTLPEFEKRFASDEACREYLLKLRWPEGFCCPRCQGSKGWMTQRSLYHCERCGLQTSLFAGTVFQDTKKPLNLWFRAIWHITTQKYGANALGLQRVLGFGSYHTAWVWLHKLRSAMVRPSRARLSGMVEVDETYIGGPKPGKRGRGAEGKALVIVAVEVKDGKIGRIRLLQVPNAGRSHLERAVLTTVQPGTRVATDDWMGYDGLARLGYRHEVIRKREDIGEKMLPKAHRVTALLKRWLLGTYQGAVKPSHLDYYLDEFTFRFNRRTSHSRGKLFYRLVQHAVAIAPSPAKTIALKTAHA